MRERKEEKGGRGREEGKRSSLVSRPCTFVTCSTKFRVNFVQYEIPREFCTANIECARPENEAKGGEEGKEAGKSCNQTGKFFQQRACTCTFLVPGGVGSNILACMSEGRLA